jgi:WD40 repeat protein
MIAAQADLLVSSDGSWVWNTLGLLSIPLLVALNGLFVAAEFALVAVRKTLSVGTLRTVGYLPGRIWIRPSGCGSQQPRNGERVTSVAFSPDGRTLASGSDDNKSNCGT